MGVEFGGGALSDAMAEPRSDLRPIIDARRANPEDDLISALVTAEGDARLEARGALEALVPELSKVARVRPEREFVDSFVVRGLTTLELQAA